MITAKFSVPIKNGDRITFIGTGRTIKEALVAGARTHEHSSRLKDLINGPVDYWILNVDWQAQEPSTEGE